MPTNKLDTVGVVVPYDFVPPTTGGTKVCYELCISLSQRTDLLCFSRTQSRQTASLKIIELLQQSIIKYFDPFLIIKLINLFRKHHVRTCILNQPFLFTPLFAACKISSCSLITYAHNLEYKRRDGLRRYFFPFIFLLEFFAFRLSDCIFFISHSERLEAIRHFRLDRNRCFFVPHIAREHSSYPAKYGRNDNTFNILFFGNFAYQPNQLGLQVLVENIIPLLAEKAEFAFRVVIFGKNLPESASILHGKENLPIELLGFVEDTPKHIQAADVLISPVPIGTGVQTKIIETLSLGTTVISAQSGARGIVKQACGQKLLTVPDDDWDSYVKKIIEVKNDMLYLSPTPKSFLSVYSEQTVVTTVLDALNLVKK